MKNRQRRSTRTGEAEGLQGWRRRVALILVAGFVIATAYGLCVAYLF